MAGKERHRQREPKQAQELQGWSMLERFLQVLEEVGPQMVAGSREDHGLRTLDRRAYFGLFLLGLFNPVITSMRALCATSALPRVQQFTGHGVVGLSRFSDAQEVFSPDILQPVLAQLLRQSALREIISTQFGRVTAQTIRIVDSTVWKVIPRMRWAQWRLLSAEACQQGVQLDARVMLMLGSDGDQGPWRMVVFQRPTMTEKVILITSQECDELSSEEVMELCRHRWQVEMFFRWLKCLVPCRHWFAHSQQGMTLQLYLALIEALLLAELTGEKPNKRMMELLQFHQMGWASDADLAADLAAGLAREQAARTKRAAAKKSI